MGAAAIGPAIGLAGSLFGDSQQSSAANQQAQAAQRAQQASQQEAAAQQQFEQEQLNMLQPLMNNYTQNYDPLNSPLAGVYGNELSSIGGQIAPTDSNALSALSSPQYADKASGTNALGMNQAAQQYLSNPGATLSGVNGTGGQAINYYMNEAKNGLNSQYAQNALSQASQGDQQSINNVMNQLGSEANPNALIQNAQNQYLSQRTNLAGQFAGESQTLSNQAMGAAQSTASGIDSQTMAMLQAAAASGNAQAQQYISNATAGANLGSSLTSGIGGAIQGAASYVPGISQAYGQVAGQYGQAAAGAASTAAADGQNASAIHQYSAANNPFMAAANAYGNYASNQPSATGSTGGGFNGQQLAQTWLNQNPYQNPYGGATAYGNGDPSAG